MTRHIGPVEVELHWPLIVKFQWPIEIRWAWWAKKDIIRTEVFPEPGSFVWIGDGYPPRRHFEPGEQPWI